MMLKVSELTVHFPVRRTFKELLTGVKRVVHAVDGISFEVERGETFALVGESGCGKTTTGKAIARLINKTSGTITLEGRGEEGIKDREYKRRVQMIFQDPYASLNPRFKIRDVLEEPLIIQRVGKSRAERMERITKAMHEVKLDEEFLTRYSHMLSGGQRQRVSIARTLVLNPELIVADEPVSMIDLSTRAEILHLMREIKRKRDLTYLYITHDLSTARYFADRMAVMYLGNIVEVGSVDDVIDDPQHPYTKALIAAVPEMVSGRENEIKELPIKGEISSAIDLPKGCRFNPRCPYAFDRCREEEPELREVHKGHSAACWLA
ncbi:MAG: ABC transporter ATP-binding protein [Candidatus Thermoplasmatota archaeon]|nr:ABC transporter ATP-binding protein [Candidatus Thermoplasmatota archaeon]